MAEDAKVTDARGGPDAQLQGTWVPVEKSMLSRLLYPNPVCLLAACDGEDDAKRNIMTITWLTPINNQVRSQFRTGTSSAAPFLFSDGRVVRTHTPSDS